MPASVTMKAGMPKPWITRPIAAPNSAPPASSNGISSSGGQCARSTPQASSMVVKATTEPTDRSMPPDRITKLMPIATTSRKALSISRLRNTWPEKKPA
jgi:hypothetical protein